MDTQKGIGAVGIIIVVAIIVIAGGAYYFLQDSEPMIETVIKSPQLVDETVGWQIYQNEKYGFSVEYPQAWELGKEADITVNPRSVLKRRSVTVTFETSSTIPPFNYPGTGLELSCWRDIDATATIFFNYSGEGNDTELDILGKRVDIAGEDYVRLGGEGEPMGFRVSRCGSSQGGRVPCVTFFSFGGPIDDETKRFIESFSVSGDLDSLRGDVCL